MKRRDELSNNNKTTEYFNELKENGNKASDIEYMARTFYGRVNILMKQKNLIYDDITKISGLSLNMIKKYMTAPFSKDRHTPTKWKKNPKYRKPSLGIVFAFAISMQIDISEFNILLDSADLAPLKEWRFFRGDDIILKYYNQVINEVKTLLERNTKVYDNIFFLDTVNTMLSEFTTRGLPLLTIGEPYSKDPDCYEIYEDKE